MTTAFKNIPVIRYEGLKSKNPLAFKHYNAGELVADKTMREHLRFAVVYWHTFCGTGSDPFGAGTMQRPWDDGSNSVANAQKRMRVTFEFIEKLDALSNAWRGRFQFEQENVRLAFAEHLVRPVIVIGFQDFKVRPPKRRSDLRAFLEIAFDNPYFPYGLSRRHGR